MLCLELGGKSSLFIYACEKLKQQDATCYLRALGTVRRMQAIAGSREPPPLVSAALKIGLVRQT